MPRTAEAPSPLVLFAATLLRVPGRRMRALALGDDGALRDWIANESDTRLVEARRDARLAFARLGELGGRVVALGDADYPTGLRDLVDPPAFLCVRGTLPKRSFRTGTAIVGARDADAHARAFAFELAQRAAGPIVSGLALGIDAAAHEGALVAGIPTLAYVANGIGATYPAEHADLEAKIVAGGGAILTEYLPDEAVSKWALVRRDRLQGAHVASVVLVQSERDGGAMHTMTASRKLGRARFALAPRADVRDTGNRVAIAEGATPLLWNIASALETFATQAQQPQFLEHRERLISDF